MRKTAHDEEKAKATRHGLLNHNVLIVWKPEYELGIRIIDEHHRGIVTTINSLYYGMQNNHGGSMLTPITGMVYDYTRVHFDIEEHFLDVCGFPDANNHHLLHEELMGKLSKVGKESISHRDPYQFMEFLKKWWIYHICEKDRLFRDYLLKMHA